MNTRVTMFSTEKEKQQVCVNYRQNFSLVSQFSQITVVIVWDKNAFVSYNNAIRQRRTRTQCASINITIYRMGTRHNIRNSLKKRIIVVAVVFRLFVSGQNGKVYITNFVSEISYSFRGFSRLIHCTTTVYFHVRYKFISRTFSILPLIK